MGNLAQRWLRRLRNLAETAGMRILQWFSVALGHLSPRAQTRIARWMQVILEVHAKSIADDATTQAAALTYATFLSLLPLILLALSAASFLVAGLGERLIETFDGIPGVTVLTPEQLDQLLKSRTDIGLIGLVGVVWAGSILASRMAMALATIFGERRPNFTNRLRAMLLTIALGLIVILAILAESLLESLPVDGLVQVPAWFLVKLILLAIELGYFLVVYRLLTPSKDLGWRDHLPGAIVMTAGYEILKAIGGVLASRTIAHWSSVYGTVGGVFGLLLLIRLAMWIFLFGAELSSVIVRNRRNEPAVA